MTEANAVITVKILTGQASEGAKIDFNVAVLVDLASYVAVPDAWVYPQIMHGALTIDLVEL